MAIYHLSVKAISRSAGRSATAAAAYRAGEWIEDERTGQQHDYTRKHGVEHTEIVVPDGHPGPDRATLWNLAEMVERRKDACVAREIEIALPSEITAEQRHALAVSFARTLATERDCAVDVCIHAPSKDGDERNHHAHLLLTTRTVQRLESGAIILGAKCAQERAGRDRKADLAVIRERWATMRNAALQYADHEARVDHRTLEAQGIDREPTLHLGPTATAIDRRAQRSIDPTAPRPDPSRKRQYFEAQVAQPLVAAKEAGELERRVQALDDAILDTASDLAAAREERDQHQARQYAEVIARGLSPAARRAVIQHGVSVMDQRDGTHWLTVHEADGVVRGIARGGAEQRHLAEGVAEALPAAVRQIESEQAARKKRAESGHREREQTAHGEREAGRGDDARAQEQTGAGRDHGQREYRCEPPPTPEELAAARAALDEYARRHQLRIDTIDGIRTASNGLRDEWVAAGNGTQRQYMALRQVRREAERAARARMRHTGRDGAQDRISGAASTHGYRSAELAAARKLGLRYDWDATARVRRYRGRTGTELFITTRRIIEMVQHNEAAEVAAPRIAAAKWGDQISIQGSSEFRERMARLAARQGIGVEDTDLHALVADEKARIARGEPPGGAERERQAAQDELEDDDEQDQDFGR